MADWDPNQGLRDWIAAELAARYALLRVKTVESIDGSRSTLAADLANSAHLLPVLDGLDELPPKSRRRALEAVNKLGSRIPLVLTCRTKEYDNATERGRGLSEAAVIEILPVDARDVGAYLIEGTEGPAERWNPVIDRLGQGNGGPLAEALSTPLMAWLARTVYHVSHTDPSELVSSPALNQVGAIRNHLLDSLLPAVISRRGQRRLSKVQRWLEHLARHASTQEAGGIAWWQLVGLAPADFAARAGRAILTGLVHIAVLVGFSLQYGLITGTASTLVFALFTFGMHKWMRRWSSWKDLEPSKAKVLPRSAGLAQGLIVAAMLAGLVAVKLWLTSGLSLGFVLLPLTLAYTVSQLVGVPADTEEARSPRVLFRDDRDLAFVRGIIVGTITGTAFGLVVGISFTIPASVAMGIGFGFTGWLLGASKTAWCRLRLAQVWLVYHGVLPLRVMTFLREAERWGVLRQAGARYQFKYEGLQRRLMNGVAGKDAITQSKAATA